MVGRHKLVSGTSISRFEFDVQKPNVSNIIHDLPGDLELDKIKISAEFLSLYPYQVT